MKKCPPLSQRMYTSLQSQTSSLVLVFAPPLVASDACSIPTTLRYGCRMATAPFCLQVRY